ncbi:entericidin A/B family lipoprotein [Sphingomonas sp. R1]|nr:entericidin A/B family lipoprotein [Sphingomonas sp. R1]UYY78712.1 entericidin A/B family lipoprotein [Sphingomonas sp. R1]
MMRKTLPLVATLGLLALGACNTVNGAGKDLRSAGSAVSDASGQNHKK